eukprot:4157275-Heterocapsa_arctica.AAC.1
MEEEREQLRTPKTRGRSRTIMRAPEEPLGGQGGGQPSEDKGRGSGASDSQQGSKQLNEGRGGNQRSEKLSGSSNQMEGGAGGGDKCPDERDRAMATTSRKTEEEEN